MKKLITTIATALLISNAGLSQTNWKLDASHSKLSFSVVHAMVSETEGRFKLFEGAISSKSESDFNGASVSFTVDAASINTEDEKRDGHLKSPDFFDVAKYPTITFKSTSMKSNSKGKTGYDVEGDLTMHGVTKKVKFTAIGAAKPVKDPYGQIKTGFKVMGVINRKDFGLVWNVALEAGGVMVSEDVNLSLNIELTKS